MKNQKTKAPVIEDPTEPEEVPPPPPGITPKAEAEPVKEEPKKEPEPAKASSDEKEKQEDKQKPLPPNPTNPLAGDDGVLYGRDFNEQWKIASAMAQSEMVPDAFRGKPAAVLMAMQTAKSRGLNPLTAIQQMANIFGRTMAYGELPLAEAFESTKLKHFEEFWIDKDGKRIGDMDIKTPVFGCVTIAEAHDSPQGKVIRIFTMDDAKTAGLLDDPKRKTWRQYHKRMLQMRSRGWALKDCVPQVTAGIGMPDYDEHSPEIDLRPQGKSLADQMNKQLGGPLEQEVQTQ